MRLLKSLSGDFQLISFNDDELPPYAILSHTWTEGQEVTYDDIVAGTGKKKTGYAKIQFCSERAAADGLEYFWVDTCCINKSTSDELSTAINSMFRWYQRARKCYVYLSDVQVPDEVVDAQAFRITWEVNFRRSRWFTRGWTLQELVAPASVEFFSKEGKRLGSKISLEQELHEITKIPISVFRGQHLSEIGIDERMSWAANRRTTVKEDKAYCLLGIFGVFMTLIYGEGEEHAYTRLRRKILRPLMEPKVGANENVPEPRGNTQLLFKPSTNIPFRRDSDFVSRGNILERIEERCSRPAGRAALVGFGGFGKSQIAIEYAHRLRQRSPETWVFWMYASNSARLEAAFSDIAEKVGLSLQLTASIDALPLVRRWLCNEANGRWLIIVDNADMDITMEMQKGGEKISLAALLPQSEHGTVLITSRNTDVARGLVSHEKDIIAVEKMSNEEAVQLLENKLGDDPMVGATQLVNALDCIPLAIVQASAYINRLKPRMSVAKYLNELNIGHNQALLLHKMAPDARRDEQASNSVLTTWQISFNYIRQKRLSAARLLSFMSFFNRQGIPEFMVRHYSDKDNQEADNSLENCLEEDGIDFEEDVAVLRAFSLVGTTQHEDEFEMHALVQLATRLWLSSTNAERHWHQAVIRAMAHEFPNGDYASWPKCQTLFPHVLPLLREEGSKFEKTGEWVLLLHNVGCYAWRQGLLALAEDMIEEALELRKNALDENIHEILLTNSLLSSILTDLGKYEESESMNRQTLAQRQNLLGLEHPNTLVSMSNLAFVLYSRGKYEEAELMNEQTLALHEKVFGPEDIGTLVSRSNMARVLGSRGKHEAAESMARETLARSERLLGPEHPDTVRAMGILAMTLNSQGKRTELESMDRETLARSEQALGPKHPDTVRAMGNLALALSGQGKYMESESINRETLVRSEQVLGPEHPDTLTIMNNLADLLRMLARYDEAESIHRQTLELREKVLGTKHPDTIVSLINLAGVLDKQGNREEAELIRRRMP